MDLFRNWLEEQKQLSKRSSSDVVSRYKRAEKLLKNKTELEFDEKILVLKDNFDFKSLSPSVKSQIKRSIKLYQEFINQLSAY